MSPILSRIYKAPGGTEALDVLMKYMYGVDPIHGQCLSLTATLTATKAWHKPNQPAAHATSLPSKLVSHKSTLVEEVRVVVKP